MKFVTEISSEDESDIASDVEIETIEDITEIHTPKGEKQPVCEK